MRWKFALPILFAACLHSQTAQQQAADPLAALRFLEGTWDAKTAGDAGGPAVSGSYSFVRELDGHILARHSSSDACKGPANIDCDHRDLLYVYSEAAAHTLKAIYFDSEGHVIHYEVSAPSSSEVVFLSDPSYPGPQFRLSYKLKDKVMSGKFQVHMPGQAEWKSYLEWSGQKK